MNSRELRHDVATFAATSAPDDGAVHLPAFKAARRLEVLSAVLDASERIRSRIER